VSARNQRRILPGDMFPGMPDVLAKRPPKAEDGDHEIRTLDEAIARSHAILDEALATYPIVGTYGLFSGGNDSVILMHLMRERMDALLHVNTGTGIPETTQHVRDVAAAWGTQLHELHPRNSYRDLVLGRVIASRGPNTGKRAVWQGFPGPVGHRVMYRHLKDEPLMTFRRSIVGNEGRTRKVVYLGGMRWAETERRFRNAEAIDQDGAIVWVSAIVHWTDAHMREYRARHRCQADHDHTQHRLCNPNALPLNEVTEHLHMSGECLCGAFAKPGELDEIEFFYPKTGAKLRALEAEAEAADLPACRWGQKPPGGGDAASPAGRLCSSCAVIPGQDDLADYWRERGLITASQHAAITEQTERIAS
jgi:3'-phosphoadenosine 5'-phosphosulfate sulfotransferase (PAPS reductase)/FAD synthetase